MIHQLATRPLKLVLSLLSLLGSLAITGSARADQPPNVVLIISDDQAWTDYGFMGHPQIQTPHLDRLARESVVFKRGYVPTALCRPSLATLITGHYAHHHGVTGNDPSPKYAERNSELYKQRRARLISYLDKFDTVPELLGKQGYLSHQSGKWWEGSYQHGGFTHGMTRGFPEPGGRHGDDGLKIGRNGMQPVNQFIRQCTSDQKPFFMWYAPFLPHTPHNPPVRLLQKYLRGDLPLPVARYYAMCEWFDETCGELIETLEETGARKNTLIVYVTDNGWIQKPTGNGYAPRSKQTPYEGGIRTPIMFSWPGHLKPADRPELVSSIDIVPTILAACGTTPADDLPGLNLMPHLLEEKPIERKAIFGEGFAHDIADVEDPEASLLYRWCIEGRYKLLLTYDGEVNRYQSTHPRDERRPQLFDLVADPHEKTNLAAKHPQIVKRLADRIADWYPVTKRKVQTEWVSDKTAAAESRPPNIVFLLIDDMGWSDVACFGHQFHETPHIDGLARDGMRFTNFYAATPVCSSTRSTIMTGQYSARTAITDFIPGHWRPFEKLIVPPIEHHLADGIQTPGDALQAAGYKTGYFGKWHLGNGAPYLPQHHGFQVVDSNLGNEFKKWRNNRPAGPKRIDLLTDSALWFIEQHREQPFFLTVSHHAVHIPVEGKAETVAKYKAKQPPETGVNHPTYAAMTEDLDTSIGSILKQLDRFELADNTIVVFTSDNGGLHQIYTKVGEVVSSNAPLREEKGTLYEGGIRVPMIVRWPGTVPAGSVCEEPATTADLLPTFCEMASASIPTQPIDGLSLVPLLKAPASRLKREAIYFHYPHYHHSRPAGAIRAGDWKLIEFFDDGSLELYNLKQDIGEQHNLAAAQHRRAGRLQHQLAAWRTEIGARMPTRNSKHDPQRAGEWWSRRTNQPLDLEAMRRRYETRKAQ